MSSFMLKLAAYLILTTLSTLAFGWMVSLIWGWYVVPAFGVAALKFKTGVGLGYLGQALTLKLPDSTIKETPVWALPFVTLVFSLIMVLCAGAWFVLLP